MDDIGISLSWTLFVFVVCLEGVFCMCCRLCCEPLRLSWYLFGCGCFVYSSIFVAKNSSIGSVRVSLILMWSICIGFLRAAEFLRKCPRFSCSICFRFSDSSCRFSGNRLDTRIFSLVLTSVFLLSVLLCCTFVNMRNHGICDGHGRGWRVIRKWDFHCDTHVFLLRSFFYLKWCFNHIQGVWFKFTAICFVLMSYFWTTDVKYCSLVKYVL